MSNLLIRFICFSIILQCSNLYSQPQSIIGHILDSKTKEPLPFVNIYVDSFTNSTSTDFNGKFSLKNITPNTKIKTAYLGYSEYEFLFTKDTNLIILLDQDIHFLDEVTITSKKTKYKRKQNPALEIILKTIEYKSNNEFTIDKTIGFNTYEKIKFNIEPLTNKISNRQELTPFKSLIYYSDSLQHQLALPIYLKEIYTSKIKDIPRDTIIDVIDSIKLASIDNLNNTFDFKIYIDQLYHQVDLYKNNIHLFNHEYTSPLASLAPLLYKYYIMDTVYINETKVVKIGFVPVLNSDYLFQGYLYISLDGSYALIKNYLTFNKNINLNWIKNFELEQTFFKMSNDKYLMNSQVMDLNFYTKIIDLPLKGKKITLLYNFENKISNNNNINLKTKTSSLSDNDNMQILNLSREDMKIYSTFDSIKKSHSYRSLMKNIQLSITGYFPTKYIEFGSLYTALSFNSIEKINIRFGFRTTYNFYKNLKLEGSLAYGLKDQKMKYNFKSVFSLNRKNVLEFPRKTITMFYIYDLFIPGQSILTSTKSNVLLSFERKNNDFWLYNKWFKIEYEQEFTNHFSYKIGLTKSIITPLSSLHFNTNQYYNLVEDISKVHSNDISLELKYSPNEKFYQGPNTRYVLKTYASVFTLNYTNSINQLFKSNYHYKKLYFNFTKRFNLLKLGKVDLNSEFGKLFGSINFPFLFIPAANQTYSNDLNGYNLMNFMEFISDQYVQVLIDHHLEGFTLNKIPYVKKLKLREFINFKILFGYLSSKNNPSLNSNLFKFPTTNVGEPITYNLNKSPYIEGSIGIGNIFRVLRIDLVKRFNYLDYKNISTFGIRAKIYVQF